MQSEINGFGEKVYGALTKLMIKCPKDCSLPHVQKHLHQHIGLQFCGTTFQTALEFVSF